MALTVSTQYYGLAIPWQHFPVLARGVYYQIAGIPLVRFEQCPVFKAKWAVTNPVFVENPVDGTGPKPLPVRLTDSR